MIKVVLIGPESTGKSTLSKALAVHYNGMYCPEFARQYLLQYGTAYTYNQLLTIAQGQLQLEDAATLNAQQLSKPLFIDTDMYVMKVWCEYVFGNCHNYITQQIAKRNYTMYLLCNIDLPWVQDELREYPDYTTRATLYNYYKDIVINSGVPWALVSGTSIETRTASAIKAIDSITKTF